ncbi:putative ubiquitin-conjugating enzyme E2 38 [Vitis riparia]|uniref:putative ubiquitin-conjugating enzyme E2 38 n=1 Tax=Vitis riparia TaxID=96939 RepID=UPI00155A74C9|nr:putative ubiquitin-conjugating enzyme E2 38 [Vitis riparia]
MDLNVEIVEKAEEDNGFRRFNIVSNDSDHHYVKLNKTATNNADCFSNATSGIYTKIMQEWKILKNNLPDSIFVRVYEWRIDLLRVVIVNVAGTLYHDGLFIFGLAFLPDYPTHPPQVHYCSFGLQLNPNLYANGRPPQDSPPVIGISRRLTLGKEDNPKLGVNWLYRPVDIKLVKRRVYDTENKCLWWLTDKDYINER